MCKFKHLQTSGNKVDLVGRLLASCTPSHMLDQYKNATIPELKEICKAKGLPVSGTKTMLVERLMDPIGFKASAKKVAPPVVAADGLVTHFQEVYEPPQTTSSSSKLPRPKSSGCGLNSSGKKPTKLMCSHTGFSVISSFGYPRDGFHSFEPLEYKAWGCFDSAQNANVFAQHVFMTKADFGSDMEEILEETSLEEDCTGGMLSMRVHPDDSEAWKVWVAAVVNGALGKGSEYDYEDEDEIEDEDDGYGNGYGYSYAF
ncbi:hypothetical protein BC829DRAFT_396881 [Chytridium lagenaria]|nr:hypothetical protein BC829DRAFT_396881 [Chytridium lagenaria]